MVGASSGIGEALARELGSDGVSVALVARRKTQLDVICSEINDSTGQKRAMAFGHDVRDSAHVGALFQEIATALGGVDLVVYASGIMPTPGADEYPTSEDVAAIETNFVGAVAWLNEAAIRFSRAGRGTIVGISSVAGDRGRTKNPIYHATKAALDTYLESLRSRLARRGVKVVTVKPGYVRTALIEDLELPGPIPVLAPDEAARQILRAAAAGKRVAYIPGWWRPVMWMVRAIPSPIFERLSF